MELISLGYTVLRDVDGHDVIVPNSTMVDSVVIRVWTQRAFVQFNARLTRHAADAANWLREPALVRSKVGGQAIGAGHTSRRR